VLVAPDGSASLRFETHRFDVTQLFDGDGSAVVLHAGADNFGNVPIEPGKYEDPSQWYSAPTGTATTGDAGGRYGCGVVQPA
jgi:superoxide dismutase, Cu-Zn family